MPWYTETIKSQKRESVRLAAISASFADACRRYGISQKRGISGSSAFGTREKKGLRNDLGILSVRHVRRARTSKK